MNSLPTHRCVANLVVIHEEEGVLEERATRYKKYRQRLNQDNSSLQSRLLTFDDWPESAGLAKDVLAEAGFFQFNEFINLKMKRKKDLRRMDSNCVKY